MEIEFEGKIWFWRGPAPWYFVTVSDEHYEALKETCERVTYGWGMIPVKAKVGGTVWETAMFHKDNSYIVPIKASVRKAENLNEDDIVDVRLEI